MVRIAPVRLAFNPKVLWFDAGDMELNVNDRVVVSTARGNEYGTVANAVFDMDYEETKKLKSPLKPVKRMATEEDTAMAEELAQRGLEALPVFKSIAREMLPDMNPVAVEFLFGGDKAVFYFESEERVDFRELVRKLSSEFHIRVDMKQIGVRDEARLVGGIGHCGQELCCRRLGGGFDPVSIRMAKEQDLSLNPQKISGICGRLMCCLRYEYDAYKDFHGRAPKKNAKVETPDGEGKVVDLNVPREVVSIKVGDEKPVKIPLSEMDAPEGGGRPTSVGEEAWSKANEPEGMRIDGAVGLFTSTLSGEDKLAEPGKVRHVHGEGEPSRSRSRRRGSGGSAEKEERSSQRRSRRRRSTTVSSDGSSTTSQKEESRQKKSSRDGGAPVEKDQEKKRSSRRRSRSRSRNKQAQPASEEKQGKSVQVGRNSSALRSGRPEGASDQAAALEGNQRQGSSRRRRRRSRKPAEGGAEKQGE